jgi:endoglucanase
MNRVCQRAVKGAALAVLLGSVVLPAEQLLTNNEFLSGMSGWQTEGEGFQAIPGSDQWGSHIDLDISDGGSNTWDVKLYQGGITLEPGYEYVLEWGASRESGSINVGLGMSEDPWTAFISDQMSFSGDYADHTLDNGGAVTYHHCGSTQSNLRFYFDLGGSNANARIAWASLGKNPMSCDGGSTGGSTGGNTGGSTGGLTNPGSGPVSYYGEMQTSGNQIVGSRTGTAVQVRGMSMFWSLWGGEDFYNTGAVNALADDWNVEIVRASMAADESGGYVDDPAWHKQLVEAVVDAAIEKEIYVIIDFHSHHAENYSTQAVQFFSEMAQKYGSYDNVIFEVYNEPLDISWGTIKNYATGVISAIRQHSDNLVIVGTPNWSQDVDAVIGNAISDNNVAYTLHFYAGTHGTWLQGKARQALNAGLPLMVTEWGTVNADGDGAVDQSSSDQWMAFMDQYKLSWAAWAVNDKAEGASAFQASVDANGSNFANSSVMTASGRYLYGKLAQYASSAEWRSAASEGTGGEQSGILREGVMDMQQFKASASDISYVWPSAAPHQLSLYALNGELKLSYHSAKQGLNQRDLELTPGAYFVRVDSRSQSFVKSFFVK